MNAFKTLVASAVLAIAAPAFAGTVIPQLTFETIGNVKNLSQAGNNPYADLGITFSNNAFGIRSSKDGGGSGNFYRDPANLGALMMYDDANPSSDGPLVLSVAGGFSNFFSIEYTGYANMTGRVEILDENDDLIVSEAFKTPSGYCPGSNSYLCIWDITKLEFTQTAKTIKLYGESAQFFFDNIQLGQPGSNVPEPSSFALGFAALAALSLSRRRKAR